VESGGSSLKVDTPPLDELGVLPLDRLKLRRLAIELSGEEFQISRLSDRKVLDVLLNSEFSTPFGDRDLVVLAMRVAARFGFTFSYERDVERVGSASFELRESFWRRVVSAQTRKPWVFICNYAENAASAVHGDIHGISYGFHEDVTTWRGLVASGEGAVVLFYNTSNAPTSARCYSGFARVQRIQQLPTIGSERRTWRAHLEGYHEIDPVHVDRVRIPGRNIQHGIQAITWTTFEEILNNSKFDLDSFPLSENEDAALQTALPSEIDVQQIAEKSPSLKWPREPLSALVLQSLTDYEPNDPYTDQQISNQKKQNRELDKETENRAIDIACAYMASQGWSLKKDCQRNGVGYDLEFGKDDETLCVEVKGIRGRDLAFNMTAKEWYKCTTLHNFLLVAVTHVLDPKNFKVHTLWPEEIVQMNRRVVQFRLVKSDSPVWEG